MNEEELKEGCGTNSYKRNWNALCEYCNHSREHHSMYKTKCNVKYCNCKKFIDKEKKENE